MVLPSAYYMCSTIILIRKYNFHESENCCEDLMARIINFIDICTYTFDKCVCVYICRYVGMYVCMFVCLCVCASMYSGLCKNLTAY